MDLSTPGSGVTGYDGAPVAKRWKSQTLEGFQRVNLDDGSVYSGEWRNGARWGSGRQTYALTRNLYQGEWVDGRWHGRGFLGLANGSWYDGNWVDGRRDGFGTEESGRERYEGEWVKDVRAGTGVLTDAHGKSWDIFFSSSGELLWKHEAVALQPTTCHEVWQQPDAPRFTPKKVLFTSVFSTLCSPRRTPAPGALPSHPAFAERTKDVVERDCDCHDQPSASARGEHAAGLENSSAEALIAKEGFIKATFVWEPNVKHQQQARPVTPLSISSFSETDDASVSDGQWMVLGADIAASRADDLDNHLTPADDEFAFVRRGSSGSSDGFRHTIFRHHSNNTWQQRNHGFHTSEVTELAMESNAHSARPSLVAEAGKSRAACHPAASHKSARSGGAWGCGVLVPDAHVQEAAARAKATSEHTHAEQALKPASPPSGHFANACCNSSCGWCGGGGCLL